LFDFIRSTAEVQHYFNGHFCNTVVVRTSSATQSSTIFVLMPSLSVADRHYLSLNQDHYYALVFVYYTFL